MDPALANLGWTEDQWNRICSVVSEEAQRARVCAQALPVVGLDDPSAIAIPSYTLSDEPEPNNIPPATNRLKVDSDPTLYITTIAVNVPVRSQELSDPELRAALTMFKRAANYIARIEDALILNGRSGPDTAPAGLTNFPAVYRVTGGGSPAGLFAATQTVKPPYGAVANPSANGNDVVEQIIAAIDGLESQGGTGPFACLLSHKLFEFLCTPTGSMIMPRDRVLPFLQGPLLRSAQIQNDEGCVVALGGSPVELVVASDISVRYLQTTSEPRYVFRVSERLALRVKEPELVARLS